MELTVVRIKYLAYATLGVMLKNEELIGYTLEPERVNNQQFSENKGCIGKGIYSARLMYSKKFKSLKIRLLDVPYFEGVLIHEGNRRADTRGCILVGKKFESGIVYMSKELVSELEASALSCLNKNEEITVRVTSIYDFSGMAIYSKFIDTFEKKTGTISRK